MSTVGRNDPCWCGSGKKYKKCHWKEDQQQVAQRAQAQQAQRARLAAMGTPSEAELRGLFEIMTGQPAPKGKLPQEARESIVSFWQSQQLSQTMLEALEPEREQWASYFDEESHEAEFEAIAAELAQDPTFDDATLTDENAERVRAELGPLPDEADARREYATRAIEMSLDDEDRTFFKQRVLTLLPALVDEGRMKEAYVVATCADWVADPEAPLSPFLEGVVVRSLGS